MTRVPAALGFLSGLEVLGLSDNRLTALPAAIARLPHLRSFSLVGNAFDASEASRIKAWFRHGVVVF